MPATRRGLAGPTRYGETRRAPKPVMIAQHLQRDQRVTGVVPFAKVAHGVARTREKAGDRMTQSAAGGMQEALGGTA